jgi:hypothetical protein
MNCFCSIFPPFFSFGSVGIVEQTAPERLSRSGAAFSFTP